MFNGETISKKNKEITNFSFSKSDFILKSLETNTTTYTKTQEMSSNQLLKCISNIYLGKKLKDEFGNNIIVNCNNQNLNNLIKEGYKRLIIPFYIPFLMLIPFMLIIVSKEDSNFKKIKLFTFLFGLLIIIFSETTIRFISETLNDNIRIFIIPFCLIIMIYFFYFNKFKNFKI